MNEESVIGQLILQLPNIVIYIQPLPCLISLKKITCLFGSWFPSFVKYSINHVINFHCLVTLRETQNKLSILWWIFVIKLWNAFSSHKKTLIFMWLNIFKSAFISDGFFRLDSIKVDNWVKGTENFKIFKYMLPNWFFRETCRNLNPITTPLSALLLFFFCTLTNTNPLLF